ncbi:MAG TPA: TIGR03768 family metallophosphoesterase [Syntrophorhabdaceae bacterium]|jgi:hypothetical protein
MSREFGKVKGAGTLAHGNPAGQEKSPVLRKGNIVREAVTLLFLLFLFVTTLPLQGSTAEPTYPISPDVQTTRQRTVRPVSIPGAPELTIGQVDQYAAAGYSSWEFGAPVDYGLLLPDGTVPATPTPAETLLNFFSISDTHITDKESPAQMLYLGLLGTFGNTNTPLYSPVILSTTHVLDAAVQTINILHDRTPFDFGIGLGDPADNNQYNALRWHIDVLDGKRIVPSSGAHKGAGVIDYQRPYQAAGLHRSISWYQAVGNHDQYWGGGFYANDYLRKTAVGNTVLDMGLAAGGVPSLDARGIYMGVVDGSTPYGTVTGAGLAGSMTSPIVAADPNRRLLTTETSSTLNWMKEFFRTTSTPKGHGFTQENLDRDFASYTFEPKASVPVKVIVLDDTCKKNPYSATAGSYSHGCLDQVRYDWLVNELDRGQAEGKLMIVAAHVPVGPQLDVPDAPVPPNPQAPNLPNNTVVPMFLSTCNDGSTAIGVPCPVPAPIENNDPVPPYSVVTDASLLATLHNYSNLILWMAGHRHINTVTPQPAPAGKGPEFGFWEVETPSTRDFPQGFRTFEIIRNSNNTVSIKVTNLDPAVQDTTSPAATSRGYAIAAARISAGAVGLTDTSSHVYNAELVKPLAAPYTITVNVTGSGTVAMGPYQAATCSVAAPCSAVYLPGTRVTLTPTPTPGSGAVFAGWSACPGTSVCNITMTGDMAITATFTNAPTMAVFPTYKSLGNVKIGRRAIATFTVRNTTAKGMADLVIGAASIAQAAPDQFSLVAGKDRCSGQTLAPGKSCTFQVSFAPTLIHTRVATITLPSNDPASPLTIPLTGVGK